MNGQAERPRVLVVDHDGENRARVTEALAQAGFEAKGAATGERALLILRQWPRPIDWLVTRTDLPGLVDGGMLADEFHQTFPDRLVIQAASSGAKRPAGAHCLVVEDPLRPDTVVAALRDLDPTIAPAVTAWAA